MQHIGYALKRHLNHVHQVKPHPGGTDVRLMLRTTTDEKPLMYLEFQNKHDRVLTCQTYNSKTLRFTSFMDEVVSLPSIKMSLHLVDSYEGLLYRKETDDEVYVIKLLNMCYGLDLDCDDGFIV